MIDKDTLCDLIPHDGAMCLLGQVLEWNEKTIVCTATSHNDKANPLSTAQGLSSIAAIEYAAQAMAAHGRLLKNGSLESGRLSYLAAVHNVEFNTPWLHDILAPITIKAERLIGDENGMIYQFSLHAGPELLVSGRVTVMMAKDE